MRAVALALTACRVRAAEEGPRFSRDILPILAGEQPAALGLDKVYGYAALDFPFGRQCTPPQLYREHAESIQ